MDPYVQRDPSDPIEQQIAWENGGIKLATLAPQLHNPDVEGTPTGSAFWPRLQSRLGGEVVFAVSIDDSDVPAMVPLIFVDNTAVHDPRSVRVLVFYYNDFLADLESKARSAGNGAQADQIAALRSLIAGDVKRTYARNAPAPPPAPAGGNASDTGSAADGEARETAYVSHRWRLKAHGRLSQSGGEQFDVDGILEGADQPPFYPFVDEADITVQSLEHLLGKGRGDCTVSFDTTYLNKGFGAGANPSEIYLRIVRPSIYLDASGSGQAVGGVAKPNTRVAALSRLRGLVGGTAVKLLRRHRPSAQRRAGRCRSHPPEQPAPQPGGGPGGHAHGGRRPFRSGGILRGALSGAKLLGLISLKDLIKVTNFAKAPQLNEKTQYASPMIPTKIAGRRPRPSCRPSATKPRARCPSSSTMPPRKSNRRSADRARAALLPRWTALSGPRRSPEPAQRCDPGGLRRGHAPAAASLRLSPENRASRQRPG